MNINELTVGQAREIISLLDALAGAPAPEAVPPYEVGTAYLIRTVTHTDIGVIVSVGAQEIVLRDVSWIADTGRYADAFVTGELGEVEPYPDGAEVIIGRGAVVDATQWPHPLPRTQV